MFYSRFFFAILAITLSFKNISHAGSDAEDLPNDLWTHIAAKLRDTKDLKSLSLVCKKLHKVTLNDSAWERIAIKYDIKSTQVRRFFEILNEHKGKEDVPSNVLISLQFQNLPTDYVSKYLHVEQRKLPLLIGSPLDSDPDVFYRLLHGSFPRYYFNVKDYAKLTVENEDKEKEKWSNLLISPILEPSAYTINLFKNKSKFDPGGEFDLSTKFHLSNTAIAFEPSASTLDIIASIGDYKPINFLLSKNDLPFTLEELQLEDYTQLSVENKDEEDEEAAPLVELQNLGKSEDELAPEVLSNSNAQLPVENKDEEDELDDLLIK